MRSAAIFKMPDPRGRPPGGTARRACARGSARRPARRASPCRRPGGWRSISAIVFSIQAPENWHRSLQTHRMRQLLPEHLHKGADCTYGPAAAPASVQKQGSAPGLVCSLVAPPDTDRLDARRGRVGMASDVQRTASIYGGAKDEAHLAARRRRPLADVGPVVLTRRPGAGLGRRGGHRLLRRGPLAAGGGAGLGQDGPTWPWAAG